MRKMSNRLLGLATALILVFGILPLTAFAAEHTAAVATAQQLRDALGDPQIKVINLTDSFVKRMRRPQKDAALAEMICQQQDKCFHTYGYRRMWQWLGGNVGIHHNPKTILRVMKKYGLLAEVRRRRKWQQMGQQLHKYQNLLNR
ncbi:MAG TPA: IS3 family transposase, partial [Candidatus Pygmaiobacter gallistercoris]|nr:IS3 family transposase [Candidatus Pygmaiobacter gallistercoris]